MTEKGRYSKWSRLDRYEMAPGDGTPVNCCRAACDQRRVARVDAYGFAQPEPNVRMRNVSGRRDVVRQYVGTCSCGQEFGLIIRPTHDPSTGKKLRARVDVRYSPL